MANTSNIPTGYAPLYLGSFNSNKSAMMERLTTQMISQAEKEDTRRARERKDMLEALSFEAVQGLGRKVQEEHLNELNTLQDKWAKKWIENGKKLTDKDYIELQRDKTDMQQKIAAMRGNVAMYAKTIQDVKQNPDMFHYSTLDNLAGYWKEGDVGKDLSELIRYMPDTNKYLVKDFGNLRTTALSFKDRKLSDDGNFWVEGYSNKDEIERKVREGLKANEYYQSLVNSGDPYVAKKAEEDVQAFISAISQEQVKPRIFTAAEIKGMQQKEMKPEIAKVANRYGFEGNENDVANAMYFNDFAKRILGHDVKALELLKSKNITGLGYVSEYKIQPNGDIILFGQPNTAGERKEMVIPSADEDDPDNMRQSMTAVLDLLPATMGGKQKPSNIQSVIRPDYEVDIKEKAMVSDLKPLMDILKVEGNQRGLLKQSQREKLIVPAIQALIPDSKVSTKSSSGGDRPITIDGRDFNLATIEERQKMLDYITAKMKHPNVRITGGKTNNQKSVEADPLNLFE